MTNVHEIAESKKTTQIAFDSTEVVYSDDKNCLLKASNGRGTIEILLTGNTLNLADQIKEIGSGELTGFFRRRSSGFNADGKRWYIWTFCPTHVSSIQEQELKAA